MDHLPIIRVINYENEQEVLRFPFDFENPACQTFGDLRREIEIRWGPIRFVVSHHFPIPYGGIPPPEVVDGMDLGSFGHWIRVLRLRISVPIDPHFIELEARKILVRMPELSRAWKAAHDFLLSTLGDSVRFQIRGSSPKGLSVRDPYFGFSPDIDVDLLVPLNHPSLKGRHTQSDQEYFNWVGSIVEKVSAVAPPMGVEILQNIEITRSFKLHSFGIEVEIFPKKLEPSSQSPNFEVCSFSKKFPGTRFANNEKFNPLIADDIPEEVVMTDDAIVILFVKGLIKRRPFLKKFKSYYLHSLVSHLPAGCGMLKEKVEGVLVFIRRIFVGETTLWFKGACVSEIEKVQIDPGDQDDFRSTFSGIELQLDFPAKITEKDVYAQFSPTHPSTTLAGSEDFTKFLKYVGDVGGMYSLELGGNTEAFFLLSRKDADWKLVDAFSGEVLEPEGSVPSHLRSFRTCKVRGAGWRFGGHKVGDRLFLENDAFQAYLATHPPDAKQRYTLVLNHHGEDLHQYFNLNF